MKNRSDGEEDKSKGKMDGPRTVNMKNKNKKKRNMTRLGGTGLSLEAFANAKSNRSQYNPSLIKKQREFYKNAKYVSKFKKKLKQQIAHHDPSSYGRASKEDENDESWGRKIEKKHKGKKSGSCGLRELYEKKREEAEKVKMEREAAIQAKKAEREKAEARRKAERERMLKKTKHGQPLMKYRIEHLLQAIEESRR